MNLLTQLSMIVIALQLSVCSPSSTDTPTSVSLNTDSFSSQTIVITKVKKPWYAWRSLVAGKMKKSFPEYQAIDGLDEKFYCFTEDHNLFGGVYFWKTRAHAEAWFTESWFARTEKTYGLRGIAEYFQIEKIETLRESKETEVSFWAALTYATPTDLVSAKGLLKIVTLRNEKSQPCVLTFWQNKESAVTYFAKQKKEAEYFDVPLHLINTK
jgi:heme-degrading monooxygenase HmoA